MSNFFITELCDRNRAMLNLEKGLNLYHLLRQTVLLKVPGDVVELGCYRGLTAILLQKTLQSLNSKKQLHLYDSFEGLPEKSELDLVDSDKHMRKCDFKDNRRVGKGWFAVGEEELKANFAEYEVPLPAIHKGWFSDTLPEALPEQIAFAHLDGDFYESILHGLEAIYPRMQTGGVIVLDDYCDVEITGKQSSLPGVKRACDAFFADKPERVEVLAAGRCYQAVVSVGA